ncbi:fumarate hydratase [Candidatus Bathyarchaeota archaeon]|nr:MAG: fumarate hydratase [Candidatus Bathyarchaeota archaeon]
MRSTSEVRLKTPIASDEIRSLRVGDVIYITGTLVTARDRAHKRMVDQIKSGKPLPVDLRGIPVYHCGPIVRRTSRGWTVVSAGPTTSMRMEPYEGYIIRRLGVPMVIGKGGMGEETTRAMKEFGAVYGAFTGGAGALAATLIERVVGVEWLDLGMPEALWIFEVEDFGPLVVAIDSHGNNLFMEVRREAGRRADEIIRRIEHEV